MSLMWTFPKSRKAVQVWRLCHILKRLLSFLLHRKYNYNYNFGFYLAQLPFDSFYLFYVLYFQLFAVLFFMMLLTLGIGTSTAMTNGIVTVVCDQFPSFSRLIVTSAVCSCMFSLGLMYVTPVRYSFTGFM